MKSSEVYEYVKNITKSKSTISFEDPRLLLEYDKLIYDDGSIWSEIEYK